jgi:hypothetical protein
VFAGIAQNLRSVNPMDIGILFIVAGIAVLAVWLLFARLSILRFLGIPNTVDVVMTFVFAALFAGTFSGMAVAGFASLMMSMSLWTLRSLIGCEVAKVRFGRLYLPEIYWKRIPAKECHPHWIVALIKRMQVHVNYA